MRAIYLISTVSGKAYVGHSFDAILRWRKHVYDLESHIHCCAALQAEYDRIGILGLQFSILEVVPQYVNILEREQIWMNKYDNLLNTNIACKSLVIKDEDRFLDYIAENWVLPDHSTYAEEREHYIWREIDKESVVDMADKCHIFTLYRSQLTFNKIMKWLQSYYCVYTGRSMIEGAQRTYKLITIYDEDKMNCEKLI